MFGSIHYRTILPAPVVTTALHRFGVGHFSVIL